MSNLDVIREKLDGGKFTDLQELAEGLLAALESIEDRMELESSDAYYADHPERKAVVRVEMLEQKIAYWTDEFAELPETCAHETYPATLETPAEGCEEDAVEGSEYCEEHSK